MSFATDSFLTGAALSAAALGVLFLASWLLGMRLGRWNVVDVTWGVSFPLVAALSFWWSSRVPRLPTVAGAVTLALTCVWGLRLAGYIGGRGRGRSEDPRYTEMLGRRGGSTPLNALRIVFVPQALISWLVSTPVQASMYERHGFTALAGIGVAVWAVGLFFEAVGDSQMAAFRADPARRGQVMDRGLWRYTRHPNYFGDACVWLGLYLVACRQWQGALTFVSPVLMIVFLYSVSGKALLEKQMAATKPGYRDYMARTSGFLPRPPRRITTAPPDHLT